MKRKYYKESIIILLTIFIFDFLRLYYVIYNNLQSFYDFSWTLLLIFLLFFNYKTNKEDKLIHLFSIILGYFALLVTILSLIQIISTGMVMEFNNYFIIFETILITIISSVHLYEYLKQRKEEINE